MKSKNDDLKKKILDLDQTEAQFGLLLREKTNPNNYVLINFEDLQKVIKFYDSFKHELMENSGNHEN